MLKLEYQKKLNGNVDKSELMDFGKKLWPETRVFAILKPSKPDGDPKNYRTMSLIFVDYKYI